jgi:TolA-binding protein
VTAPEYCPDDLFARARAGSISVKDQEQLDRHIAGCSECRALLLVSRGFEQRALAQAGDTQLLARMVDRVRAARAPAATDASTDSEHRSEKPGLATRRRSRLSVLLLAAALTAGVATAARAPATRRFVERMVGSKVTRPAPAAASVAKRSLATRVLPAESAAPTATPQPAPPTSSAPPVAATAAIANAQARATEAPTAERLFAEANARRKAGDTAAARRLYIELAKRFPGSPEAQVSSASLGRLLLERSDDAAGALEQFDRLLARPAASMAQPALAEEALFGRATALMRLGRAKDEKAAWGELLARFPGSVYAERAHERLRALK